MFSDNWSPNGTFWWSSMIMSTSLKDRTQGSLKLTGACLQRKKVQAVDDCQNLQFIYAKKQPNQAPDPKLAFYSERWGQRCIIHILVHNTEAKLFSEVSPVWKLLPLSLPTPKTYCIFTRATSIRPTAPPPFFWYKLCKTFVLRTFLPPQTKKK